MSSVVALEARRDIRLLELDPGRRWESTLPPSPPADETRRGLDRRLEEIAPLRERAFEAIDRMHDEIVACLQDLVRIPSVNPGDFPGPDEPYERDLAEHVMAQFRSLGMSVQSIEPAPRRTSVLGRLPGTRSDRSLLFYGHLDTVPTGDPAEWTYPPFSATVADGKVWGRGTKDCKLGLAAALMAVRALERADLRLAGDVQIVAPADEETGGHWGIAQMVDGGMIHADWAIYGEGRPEVVTIGHRGMMNVRVTTRGKTAHTARKELGENAFLKMCKLAPRLDAIEFKAWREHPVVPGGPVASANIVRGGFKENVVPDRCTVTFDVRFPPGTDHRALVEEMRAVIGRVQADHPDLGEVELEVVSLARPSFTDPNHPLVIGMQRFASEVQGRPVGAVGMVATSDSRWILLDAGIPIVNFSMGNETGHCPNEWAGVEDLIVNTKIYALAALALLA